MRTPKACAGVLLLVLIGPAAPAAVTECSVPAAAAMPDGEGHDHEDPGQHETSCFVRSVAYAGLEDLVPEAVEFGEADIAKGLVAMAVAYPEAGFVLFDVSAPARPRALSRFRSDPCEVVVMDYDCGADVKLSDDGTLAFLALQKTRVPQGEPPGTTVKPDRAGIVVVDITNPRSPREASFTPIGPRGTHLLFYRRMMGAEYVFAVHNGVGFSIYRLTRPATLSLVADVTTKGTHDVFPYEDPVDKKSYVYLSGANAGFFVYDVTDPAKPRLAGEWHPVVERPRETWYVHTAWTFREGARRFTLVGPELSQPGRDHGAVAAPLWLLDTTDHAKPVLVGEWRNPAGRAAGALGFSVHNFWYEDGRTWVAHYHGGVWLLDWRPVLDGASRNPDVAGFYLPHESRRTFVNVRPRHRFLSAFDTKRKPMVWDVVSDGEHAYASDITGGFSVLSANEPVSALVEEGTGLAVLLAAGAVALVASSLLLVRRRRKDRARL